MPRSWDVRGAGAFSFVEVILAVTILTMLVGISVTTYSDSVAQSRRDLALQKLQHLGDAIQRWEMEKNGRYPYASLRPLEGEYLRNLEADPWGSEFAIDLDGGIVYSYGPNAEDDHGGGDDIRLSFDTDRDPPPGAPSDFRAVRADVDIRLTWVDPLVNADGSPINGDLSHYNLYMRRSRDASFILTSAAVPTPGAQPCVFLASTVGAVGETVYFMIRPVDTAGHEGPPSNTAGLFIVAETKPVINVFRVDPIQCPLRSAFSVFIDVSDGDANLTQLRLTSSPSVVSHTWTTGAAAPNNLDNTFHPVITYTFTPVSTSVPFELYLEATDGASPPNTVQTTFPYLIEFTNSPPRINTLSPGVFTMTINPLADGTVAADFKEMTYLIEAGDDESNMTSVCLSAAYVPGDNPVSVVGADGTGNAALWKYYDTWTYGGDGVGIAVESKTHLFLPKVEQVVNVKVWANDAEGQGGPATAKVATLNLSRDNTPPAHVSVWLDDSNPILAEESFPRWWIRDRSADLTDPTTRVHCLRGGLYGWENESPPITFCVGISTYPVEDWPNFLTHMVTWEGTDGWVEFKSDASTGFEVNDLFGLAGGFTFQTDETYFLAVRAKNSVDVWTNSSATPRSQVYKLNQNGFGWDPNPPEIESITVDSLGAVVGTSDVWVDNQLDVTWVTRDYRIPGDSASGVGSGPKIWEYRIFKDKDPDDSMVLPFLLYDRDWAVLKSPELKDFPLDPGVPGDPPNPQFVLELRARDTAGNWSDIVTAGARMDLTTPAYTGIEPRITNALGGFLYAGDTVEGSWAGTFVDPESQIESYDWGVCTTQPLLLGVPDLVPWQHVDGSTLVGAFVKDRLLTQGDTVYLAVRARNYSRGVSGIVYSSGAVVDIDLVTSLDAAPRTGYEAMSVAFTINVSGGATPYEYTFLFDGTTNYASRIWTGSTSSNTYTTSFLYDIAEFGPGRHSAVVHIQDFTGIRSIKNVYFDLHPSPMVGVLRDGFTVSTTRFSLYRVTGGTLTPHFDTDFGLDNQDKYVRSMDVSKSGNLLAIAYDDSGGDRDGVWRWAFKGHRDSPVYSNYIDLNSFEEPRDVVISPDASFILVSGEGHCAVAPAGEFGWVQRVMIKPTTGAPLGSPTAGFYGTAKSYLFGGGLACWAGGYAAAACLWSSSDVSGPRHRIENVDLGDALNLSLLTNRYFGNDSTTFENLRWIAVSPSERTIAAVCDTASRAFIANTLELASGTGSRPTTAVPPATQLVNPVWRFDSRVVYSAGKFNGDIYYLDTQSGAPAWNAITVDGASTPGATPFSARYLDVSKDGRWLVLVTASALHFAELSADGLSSVKWKSITPMATPPPLQVRFMNRPLYGAPTVEEVGVSGTAGGGPVTFTCLMKGSNFITGQTTVTKIRNVSQGVDASSIVPGVCNYDEMPLTFTCAVDGTPDDTFTFTVQNSIGATVSTTTYTRTIGY